MPNVQEYQSGFGILDGTKIDGYTIRVISMVHQQVVRWNRYSYPSQIELYTNTPSSLNQANQALQLLSSLLVRQKIIRTESGRPYLCTNAITATHISDDHQHINIMFTGEAVRVPNAEAIKFP